MLLVDESLHCGRIHLLRSTIDSTGTKSGSRIEYDISFLQLLLLMRTVATSILLGIGRTAQCSARSLMLAYDFLNLTIIPKVT
jgi:hypothetical protein